MLNMLKYWTLCVNGFNIMINGACIFWPTNDP